MRAAFYHRAVAASFPQTLGRSFHDWAMFGGLTESWVCRFLVVVVCVCFFFKSGFTL